MRRVSDVEWQAVRGAGDVDGPRERTICRRPVGFEGSSGMSRGIDGLPRSSVVLLVIVVVVRVDHWR